MQKQRKSLSISKILAIPLPQNVALDLDLVVGGLGVELLFDHLVLLKILSNEFANTLKTKVNFTACNLWKMFRLL